MQEQQPAPPTSEDSARIIASVVQAFFEGPERMQKSISVLCESNLKQNTDTITPTLLAMLSYPLQVQLTAVGWQPFKSKDLTYPYNQMTQEQKQVLRSTLVSGITDTPPHPQLPLSRRWGVFEHAMMYRTTGAPPAFLKPLDVLSALCSSVLNSSAYQDKRLRVAICNILLQRVQASVPLDKHTQTALNERLFQSGAATLSQGHPQPPAQDALKLPRGDDALKGTTT
jgi:hypothetical protein